MSTEIQHEPQPATIPSEGPLGGAVTAILESLSSDDFKEVTIVATAVRADETTVTTVASIHIDEDGETLGHGATISDGKDEHAAVMGQYHAIYGKLSAEFDK